MKQIVLRDEEHNPIAVMDVEDLFTPDKELEAMAVFGGDPEHPAVDYLKKQMHEMYIGGKLHGLQLPKHYDYKDLRYSPQELRKLFAKRGWSKICAFQTRNPMHRAHIELTRMALDSAPDMNLLIHPVVGMTKPGDIDHHTRVKCYKAILPTYPAERTCLSVFPLAMRMGGPREAIWHCLIRRNYGATHFILGRDHAGPGSNSSGQDFYSPFAARDAAVNAETETGIKCMSFEQMVYCVDNDKYFPETDVPKGKEILKLSGTEVRRRLRTGEEIPDWFSYSEVVSILRTAHPPRHKQGITIFFTGLSGSGKSTVGNALREKLMELDSRRLSMLDGDHVRKLISSELSFSKEHRNLNIRRIGYIASLINGAGGIVIAAPIAPYEESRAYARQVISELGAFIEVFVSTPVSECAKRDTKGLYAKAKIDPKLALTGVGDEPYEKPTNAEIVMDTTERTVESCVDDVIQYLFKEGYLVKNTISEVEGKEKILK